MFTVVCFRNDGTSVASVEHYSTLSRARLRAGFISAKESRPVAIHPGELKAEEVLAKDPEGWFCGKLQFAMPTDNLIVDKKKEATDILDIVKVVNID